MLKKTSLFFILTSITSVSAFDDLSQEFYQATLNSFYGQAIVKNDLVTAEALFQRGAQPIGIVKCRDGKNVDLLTFMSAVRYGLPENINAIKMLLAHGANPNIDRNKYSNDCLGGERLTALGFIAASLAYHRNGLTSQYVILAEALLEAGANPLQAQEIYGISTTPLGLLEESLNYLSKHSSHSYEEARPLLEKFKAASEKFKKPSSL